MGCSALSLASMNDRVEVVKVLLKFGAQVDLPNDVRWLCEFVTVAFNVHIATE
jgi:ankyrin repeat protein